MFYTNPNEGRVNSNNDAFFSFLCWSACRPRQQHHLAHQDRRAVASVQPAAQLHQRRERPGDTETEGESNDTRLWDTFN